MSQPNQHLFASPPSTPVVPDPLWVDDLRRAAAGPLHWLWHGYLAGGAVTLLTSQWKAGKTTLVAVLLARMGAGGELAGSAIAAGRAAVVSEEGPGMWERRAQKLNFGPHVCWFCRPFRGKPSPAEWEALIDRLAELHDRRGLALAVIDPLAAFLPGPDENNAATMMAALAPLHRLTSRGVSVLLVHHPRKAGLATGVVPRGSGALPAFADVLIELDWHRRGVTGDRRRHVRAASRFEETPPVRLIELTEDGTDYTVVTDPGMDEFTAGWTPLRMVLEDAWDKVTRQQILAQWPPDFDKPSPSTLWAWLQRAVAAGQVCQKGSGRRSDPFCYWLPGREGQLGAAALGLEELPPLEPLDALDLLRTAKKAVRRLQTEME